jgi:hypothetical protein
MQSVDFTQSGDLCRPLGAGERIFWLHDRAHPLHFALTAQISGSFNIRQLQQALTLIQQRHPLLRVRIAIDETDRPWFVEHSASIPLRVVQRQSEDCWQREVEAEIATPFDWSQAPLMRAVLVGSDRDANGAELFELIVVCHHSIADGISSAYLLRDILQAISTPTAFGYSLPVPPSLEQLIPSPTPTLEFEPPQFTSNSAAVERLSMPARHSYVSSGMLSPETTLSLITRCRQEQTTVHAAICAAFILALHSQSPSARQIHCASPISLRSYLTSVDLENIICCIGSELTSHLLSPAENFWDVAHAVKQQLSEKMTPDKLFEKIYQGQEWLASNPSPDVALQVFTAQFGYDIAVSNLRRLPIEQQFPELELHAIYGPVVTTGVPTDRLVGVATLGDRLFYTLVCSELVMSRSQSERLLAEAIEILTSDLR